MSKQTAVEYLLHELHAAGFIEDITDPLLIQRVNEAKAMEREQIEDAYWEAYWEAGQDVPMTHIRCSEYYEQTYGKEASHEG